MNHNVLFQQFIWHPISVECREQSFKLLQPPHHWFWIVWSPSSPLVKETTCLCSRASGRAHVTSSEKRTFWGWTASHFHRYSIFSSHTQGFPPKTTRKEDVLSSSSPEGERCSWFWLSSRSSRCWRPWRRVPGSSWSWLSCKNSCDSFRLWLKIVGVKELKLLLARFSVSRRRRFLRAAGSRSRRLLSLTSRFSRLGSLWRRAAGTTVKRLPDKSNQVMLLLPENHSASAVWIRLFLSTRLWSESWRKTLEGRWTRWFPVRSNVFRWGTFFSRSEGRLFRLVWYSWRSFKRGTALKWLAVTLLRLVDWMDRRVVLEGKPSTGKCVRALWLHTTSVKEQEHRSGQEWAHPASAVRVRSIHTAIFRALHEGNVHSVSDKTRTCSNLYSSRHIRLYG